MQSESPTRRSTGRPVTRRVLGAGRVPTGRTAGLDGSARTARRSSPSTSRSTDRSVRIRTAAYSEAARECDDSPVAFEVDTFDEAERSGWSVLMRGHAHLDFAAPVRRSRPRCLAGRLTEPAAPRRGRGDHWPADPRRLTRLSAAQDCGCLVAKIAAWVRLVSPSLASIEET